MTTPPPVALTIAGSDCSSGAGIQADLKTFQHFRVHGLTAITCVVSETANVVRHVHPVPVDIVRDQVELLLESLPVAAVKTGMLFSSAHVHAVADVLERYPHIPVVADPVMIASTGDPLLEQDAIQAYQNRLLPLSRLVTPNLPEASTLLDKEITAENFNAAALRLSSLYQTAVLLKGGHLPGPECVDILALEGTLQSFSSPRLPLPGSHGTGCTFSAAIAARLALGDELPAAISNAKSYLDSTLATSYLFLSSEGNVHALNQGTLPF